MRPWAVATAILVIFCASVQAQTSVPCPAYVLAETPAAECVARNQFTFLVFGSVKVPTPSQGCDLVRRHIQNVGNVEASCRFTLQKNACECLTNGNHFGDWEIREDSESLEPVCPTGYLPLPERVVITGAEGYRISVPVCRPQAVCRVKPLLPITDPIAQQHETGPYSKVPDMENVSDATKAGAKCILQRETNSSVGSGFRPQAYQDHLREVWDKWEILKKDKTEACKKVKKEVQDQYSKHGMRYRPGTTSNHTTGIAVDISGIPAGVADKTAAACNMHRPYQDDPVHFQPSSR